MRSTGDKTEPDTGSARRSARDQWVQSALVHFLAACEDWRARPDYSVMKLRLVLEGWAHATALELDGGFAPYKGGELHRGELGELLKGGAMKTLPRDLQAYVKHAKAISDSAHHNQGSNESVAPQMAQGALIQCAALIDWTYREIVRTDPPFEFISARQRLRGMTLERPAEAVDVRPTALMPVSRTRASGGGMRPWLKLIGVTAGLAAVVAVVAASTAPRGGASGASSTSATSSSTPTSGAAPGTAPPLVPSTKSPAGPDARAVQYAEAYGRALSHRDVDQILRLHAFPTRRFFSGRNYSEKQVRDKYEGWFAGPGLKRETGLRNCTPLPPSPVGDRAARCDVYVDPPLPSGPSVVPSCLVFNPEGLLVSRTQLDAVAGCPPP